MTESNKEKEFNRSNESEINYKEMFFSYFRYWYLFALSIIISFSLAYIYNRYSARVYLVSSKILVQDEKKSPSGTEILKELDIFKGGGIIENEIEIIHSRPVISKALGNLNFGISYYGVGDIKTSELYNKDIPFRIEFDTLSNALYGIAHKVYFDKNGKITFTLNEKEVAIKYNELIKIDRTNFKFIPNIGFNQSLFLGDNQVDRNYLVIFNGEKNLIDEFYTNLKVVTVNKMATVLDLSIKTSVPEKGKDFLDEVAEVYIKRGVDQKSEMAAHTLDFIQERLTYVTNDLSNIEAEAEKYKISKGIANVSEESKFLLEGVKEYDKELSEIKIELEYIEQIQKNLTTQEFKVPPFIGPANSGLENLISELYNLESLKINYNTTIKKDNPLNTIIKEQIFTAQENIKRNISGLIESLKLKEGLLKNKLSGFEKNIEKVPTIERDLLSIERQKVIKENLYLYLLQKQEESSIALAATVADNKVIEPAFFSAKPIKPQSILSYLIAAILGFSLPLLFVYLKDILNDKILSKNIIEKATNTPIIGVVSLSDDTTSAIAVHAKARTVISEEFRSIRTNLQFAGIGVKDKVILITSSISGEGKTFITLNLALTFAISGKKTVVLEMDLRKPKLSKSIENQNEIGISNYLIGQVKVNEIINKSGVNDDLYIISSGPIPHNPAELLLTEKLKQLVAELKEQFDIVIIDSPPIGLVTDSLIISQYTDTSLYIVRQGRTPKAYLTSISELHQTSKMKNLSIVFNGLDRKIGGYGYGYGYGYYAEDEEKKSFFSSFKMS